MFVEHAAWSFVNQIGVRTKPLGAADAILVTHLRRVMLEELQRRNYANYRSEYLQAVERFAKHFKRSPDQLNQDHLRTYQAYLLCKRKLEPRTVKLHVSALRFFFVKTLKRSDLLDDIPYRRSRVACRRS